MEASMSFRKAVAQAYCLHKHIVNEYHYEQHVCGAQLVQSALSRKKRLIVLSPLQYVALPPGTLRGVCACDLAVLVPLLLRNGGD